MVQRELEDVATGEALGGTTQVVIWRVLLPLGTAASFLPQALEVGSLGC